MNMRSLPASAIVAAAVRDQIVSGELQPGDRTPSARQLAREYGISAATASKALNQLAAVGLIAPRPGVGMIVEHGGPSRLLATDRVAVAQRTGAINREGEHAKRLSAQDEPVDARVRAALRLDTARAFCRRRVRYDANNRPTEHSASWFSLDVARQAPRLYELEAIDEGTLAYVAQVTGRQVATIYEEFYAREADDFDAEHAIAQVGRPVLVVEFTAYDDAERPLTYETTVYPERERVTAGPRPT